MKRSLSQFFKNIYHSIFRHGYPLTDKEHSEAVMDNFFLHIHPVKVHRHTLRPTTTLGLGLTSFYLLLILTITGILLMFYYIPSVHQAYESMKDLRYVVSFGRFLRNMHRWAAHGMVITVFLHMCRVFFTGSYKPPREFNWVLGVILLLLTLFLSFTGYLLPWDQLSLWAVTVGTNIASYAPFLGEKIRYLLLGGNTVGQNALLRFYVLHVAVLPLAVAILLGVHFWRIRKDGGLARSREDSAEIPQTEPEYFSRSPQKTYGLMALVKGTSRQIEAEPEQSCPSWPHLLFWEAILFMTVLLVMVVLAAFFNAPLEEPANFTHPPNPAKAPWYFLGLQELVSHSAFWGGVAIPTLALLVLLLLPYVDRNPKGSGRWFARERWLATTLFSFFVIAVIILTLIGMYFRGPNWSWVWPWAP